MPSISSFNILFLSEVRHNMEVKTVANFRFMWTLNHKKRHDKSVCVWHCAMCPCVTMLVILLLLAPFFPVYLCPPPLSPVCARVFCLLSGTGSSGDIQKEEAVRWNSREFSPSCLSQHGSLHRPKPVRLLFLFSLSLSLSRSRSLSLSLFLSLSLSLSLARSLSVSNLGLNLTFNDGYI